MDSETNFKDILGRIQNSTLLASRTYYDALLNANLASTSFMRGIHNDSTNNNVKQAMCNSRETARKETLGKSEPVLKGQHEQSSFNCQASASDKRSMDPDKGCLFDDNSPNAQVVTKCSMKQSYLDMSMARIQEYMNNICKECENYFSSCPQDSLTAADRRHMLHFHSTKTQSTHSQRTKSIHKTPSHSGSKEHVHHRPHTKECKNGTQLVARSPVDDHLGPLSEDMISSKHQGWISSIPEAKSSHVSPSKLQSHKSMDQGTKNVLKDLSKSVTAIEPYTEKNDIVPVVCPTDMKSNAKPSQIRSQVAASSSTKVSHIAPHSLQNQAESHLDCKVSEPLGMQSHADGHVSCKSNRQSPSEMQHHPDGHFGTTDNPVALSRMQRQVEDHLSTKVRLLAPTVKQKCAKDELSNKSSRSSSVSTSWIKSHLETKLNTDRYSLASSSKQSQSDDQLSTNGSPASSWMNTRLAKMSDGKSCPAASSRMQCQPDGQVSTDSSHLPTSWMKKREDLMMNDKSCSVESADRQSQSDDHLSTNSTRMSSWMKNRAESIINPESCGVTTCNKKRCQSDDQVSTEGSHLPSSSWMKSRAENMLKAESCGVTTSEKQCQPGNQVSTEGSHLPSSSWMKSRAENMLNAESCGATTSKEQSQPESQPDDQVSAEGSQQPSSWMKSRTKSILNAENCYTESLKKQSQSDGQPRASWPPSWKSQRLMKVVVSTKCRDGSDAEEVLCEDDKMIYSVANAQDDQISSTENTKHRSPSKRPTTASHNQRYMELSQLHDHHISRSKSHKDCSHPHTDSIVATTTKPPKNRKSNPIEDIASPGCTSSVFSNIDQARDNHVVLNQKPKAFPDTVNSCVHLVPRSMHSFTSKKPSRASQPRRNSGSSHLTTKPENHEDYDHSLLKGSISSASPSPKDWKQKEAQLHKKYKEESSPFVSKCSRDESQSLLDSDIQPMHTKKNAWDHDASSPSLSSCSDSKIPTDLESEDYDCSCSDSGADSQSNQFISENPSTSEVRKYTQNLSLLKSDSEASVCSNNSKVCSDQAEYPPKHLAAMDLKKSVGQSCQQPSNSLKPGSQSGMPSMRKIVKGKPNRNSDSARSNQMKGTGTRAKSKVEHESPPYCYRLGDAARRDSRYGLEIIGISHKQWSSHYNAENGPGTTEHSQFYSAQEDRGNEWKMKGKNARNIHINNRKEIKAIRSSRENEDNYLRKGNRPEKDIDQENLDHSQLHSRHKTVKSTGGQWNNTVKNNVMQYNRNLSGKMKAGLISRGCNCKETQRLAENIQQCRDRKYLGNCACFTSRKDKGGTGNKSCDGKLICQDHDKQLSKVQIRSSANEGGNITRSRAKKESLDGARASLDTAMKSSIKREIGSDGKVKLSLVIKKNSRNVQWGGRQSWFVEPLGCLPVYD